MTSGNKVWSQNRTLDGPDASVDRQVTMNHRHDMFYTPSSTVLLVCKLPKQSFQANEQLCVTAYNTATECIQVHMIPFRGRHV